MIKGNRGSVSIFTVFIILAITIVLLSALVMPLVINFNTKIYQAAEPTLLNARATASTFQDANVSNAVLGSITSAQDSISTNIEIHSLFFTHSWFILIVMIALALWIYSRQQVELEARII